ncbi:MAG: flagellar M-ring protein FliF [Fusobacteria bacterium]|nr:flagellar M-ring protein FliF [Fusobacteriota bacterium]
MNETLERLKEAFLKIWNKLSKAQKFIISGAVISFFVFLIIYSTMANKVKYQPLFTDLEPKDAATIKELLDKKSIKYKITGNGSVIEVDSKEKYNLRLDLAKDGFMPDGNTVGFEIFDTAKISATEFDKKMMFLRGQKGELERTIKSLKQIKRASVNITPSNDSIFAEEKTDAKASVLIELEPFERLNPENIKAIILLVASGVDGLVPENIDVMDTSGNILSDLVEFGSDISKMGNKKIEMQHDMEKKLRQNASSVLNVLGGGNFRITVSVELDFNKEQIASEMFSTPTIGGEEMLEGLKRSVQQSNEQYENRGTDIAMGAPGTDTNIPGYVGQEENINANNKYNKSNSIVNYELNKTQSSFEKSLGSIKRMTISVNINKKADYFKDSELTDEKINIEKQKFINMVKTAVGFNEKRGDSINVEIIPFDMKTINQYHEAIELEQKQKTYSIIAGIVFAIIIIIGIIVYYILKRKEEFLLREKERRAVEELIPEFDEIILGKQLNVEDQERLEKEEEIKEIAKKKPEEVAGLIKAWLADD